MNPIVDALAALAALDRLASHAAQDVRLGPLTALFVLASAWWVKGLLIAGIGGLADLAARRRLPACAVCSGAAAAIASVVAAGVKLVFERARPPLADLSLEAAVALPHGYSFPSGHATTAFAAAAAVAAFHPRLRWPIMGLAALVALSRVYLVVHFPTDVLVGAALGTAIGLGAAWATRRVCEAFPLVSRRAAA